MDKVFECPRFEVIKKTVNDRVHYYVSKPSAVAAICYNSRGIGLVTSKRVVVEQDSFELPGGRIEGQEFPRSAIIRELEEEVGIKETDDIEFICPLFDTWPLPSVTDEIVYVFQVKVREDFEFNTLGIDAENEQISKFELVTIREATELVLDGLVLNAVDALAILYFKEKGLLNESQ